MLRMRVNLSISGLTWNDLAMLQALRAPYPAQPRHFCRKAVASSRRCVKKVLGITPLRPLLGCSWTTWRSWSSDHPRLDGLDALCDLIWFANKKKGQKRPNWRPCWTCPADVSYTVSGVQPSTEGRPGTTSRDPSFECSCLMFVCVCVWMYACAYINIYVCVCACNVCRYPPYIGYVYIYTVYIHDISCVRPWNTVIVIDLKRLQWNSESHGWNRPEKNTKTKTKRISIYHIYVWYVYIYIYCW